MKKVITMLLVVCIFLGAIPVCVNAASETLIEIVVDNAPIRETYYESGKVVARCAKGSVLTSTGTKRNLWLNKWYKVNYNGISCYIYSGNVEIHEHEYFNITVNDVTYNICDCGKVSVSVNSTSKIKQEKLNQANSFVSYASAAGLAASVDGPIPLGDVIGLGILVLGAYVVYENKNAVASTLQGVLEEIDFAEYAKEHKETCTDYNFHEVTRENGALYFVDDKCYSIGDAFILSRYQKRDMYTKYEDTALACVKLNGANNYFLDRDANKPDYYYHYHYGDKNHKVGGHVFFGITDSGLVPTLG